MKPVEALAYAEISRRKFLGELRDFLAIPSVSSDRVHHAAVNACAAWLAQHLKRIGLSSVEMLESGDRPVVYAAWQHAPERPTVLIYGHYDVVPPGAIERWESHPFQPVIRGDRLFARGASDDKGQLFCHLKAIEAFLGSGVPPPVNVKYVFEGEEEIGSPSLGRFFVQHRDKLRADAALISDTALLAPGRPAISYAQRGGLRVEVEVRGAENDLHSGTFGGAVRNPVEVLCTMLAGLHNARGRITIPRFYEDVVEWPATERASMRATGPSDSALLARAKVRAGWGEPGFTAYERTTIRPSLTISGISGGHTGEGVKSIIPSFARAKLTLRLVPSQDPLRISRLLRSYLAELTPPTVETIVEVSAPVEPVMMDRRHWATRIAEDAYERGFGRRPALVRSGGSLPVVHMLQEALHLPVVLMGFALPDAQIHGPNENLHLPTFFRSINTAIWYLALAGEAGATRTRGRRVLARERADA